MSAKKSGWVQKQGGSVQSWKTRWMVLIEDTHVLAYYKSQLMKDKEKKGEIELKEVTKVALSEDVKGKKPHCFTLFTPKRDYMISTASSSDTNSWVQEIEAHLKKHFPRRTVRRSTSMGAIMMQKKKEAAASKEDSALAALEEEGNSFAKKGGSSAAPASDAPSGEGESRMKRTKSANLLNVVAGAAASAKETVADAAGPALRRTVSSSSGLGAKLNRSISKNMTYIKGADAIGKIYLTANEAAFNDDADPSTTKPFLVAYLERQEIESAPSKDPNTPKWKDSFLFSVFNIESRLKLSICNKSPKDVMAEAKIPIKILKDGKQRREWYELKGDRAGKILLTWRFEAFEDSDKPPEVEQGEVIGTFQLTVISARGLKTRDGGSNRNPMVELAYGPQQHKTEPIDDTLTPEWNFVKCEPLQRFVSSVLWTKRKSLVLTLYANKGTAVITSNMLRMAGQQETSVSRWLPLLPHDDPDRAYVGGEIYVRFGYKDNPDTHPENRLAPAAEIKTAPAEDASGAISPRRRVTVGSVREEAQRERDLVASLPEGFPKPPPPVPATYEGTDKEGYKAHMKKKMNRSNWENSLVLYKQKELEGDRIAMKSIIQRVRQELQDAADEAELPPSVPFPDEVPKGEGQAEYKIYMKQKIMREKWENGLLLYRMREGDRDKAGMAEVARRVYDELEEIRRDIDQLQRDAGIDPASVSQDPEALRALLVNGLKIHVLESSKPKPPPKKLKSSNSSRSLSIAPSEAGPEASPSEEPVSPRSRRVTLGSSRASADMSELPSSPSIGAQRRPTIGGNRGPPANAEANPFDDVGEIDKTEFGQAGNRRSLQAGNPYDEQPTPNSAKDIRRSLPPTGSGKSDAYSLTGPFSLQTALTSDTQHDLMYKVIIIGDSGVGKTNLLGRWMEDKFNATSATINVEFATKSFQVSNKVVKVQLWDTAGQEQYRAVTRSYYRFSRGALIVYDITNQQSFERVESWLSDVRDAPGNEQVQILLIGNKSDLAARREVPTDVGLNFAKENSLYFMETSALSGNNVHRAFQILLQEIHKIGDQTGNLEGGSGGQAGNLSAGKRTVVLGGEAPVQEEGCSC